MYLRVLAGTESLIEYMYYLKGFVTAVFGSSEPFYFGKLACPVYIESLPTL